MSRGKKVERRGTSHIQIGPKGGIGIIAGVGLAIAALAIFHSASVMALLALFFIILWIVLPKKKK